ncbi:ABC transporter permease [Mesorhizobium sp. B292B1B]|uniref:ABC transporter permease n=1 Tax=unclassified Mesorhizobium TaxID=325217 RepID=UPI0015E2ADDC|nr:MULTISPECIES: ABC transporter permease [unclassified Mesorhizobium]MCA0012179.1 ABC transporter permease [Mesorhizobium sp. B294B1A1]MCA0039239.1 ABC transporter permease [Mesorhizobium sp. B292B1B]
MTDAAMETSAATRNDRFTRGSRLADVLSKAGLGFAILAVMLYGSFVSPAFFTTGNLLNVLTSMSIVGIVVVGMTFVLVAGGLADLSVPAAIACGAILSLGLQPMIGPVPAFVLAVALAGLIGLLNGVLVGYVGINPIIATLGIGTIGLGIVQAAVGGVIVYGNNPASAEFAKGRLFGVPVVVLIFLLIALIGHFVLSRSFWGRWTLATGGNYRAAEASAVPVEAVKAGAFVITALASGVSGGLLGLTLQSARPLIGAGYEFSAITAVVVGGVSIIGGFGSVPRAIAGLIFVQLLTNVMVLDGVRTPIQGFVLGILIVGAVGMDVALRKRGVA